MMIIHLDRRIPLETCLPTAHPEVMKSSMGINSVEQMNEESQHFHVGWRSVIRPIFARMRRDDTAAWKNQDSSGNYRLH